MWQLSEAYGRRPIFLFPFGFYTLTQVGSALSPNTATLLTSRFLGGPFAAAPLTNSGYVVLPSSLLAPDTYDRRSALFGDLWVPDVRGNALALLALGPLVGPTVSLRIIRRSKRIPLNGA